MKYCNKCKLKLDTSCFYKNSYNKDGLHNQCKVCKKKYDKEYRSRPENIIKSAIYNKEYRKTYEIINKDRIARYKKVQGKRYRSLNRDRISTRQLEYRRRFPDKPNSYNAKRRADKLNATPIWSEFDKIQILYDKAKWLESLTGLKYHVDHIIPLTSNVVCGLHVWANLQILEASVNIKKGNSI